MYHERELPLDRAHEVIADMTSRAEPLGVYASGTHLAYLFLRTGARFTCLLGILKSGPEQIGDRYGE